MGGKELQNVAERVPWCVLVPVRQRLRLVTSDLKLTGAAAVSQTFALLLDLK